MPWDTLQVTLASASQVQQFQTWFSLPRWARWASQPSKFLLGVPSDLVNHMSGSPTLRRGMACSKARKSGACEAKYEAESVMLQQAPLFIQCMHLIPTRQQTQGGQRTCITVVLCALQSCQAPRCYLYAG